MQVPGEKKPLTWAQEFRAAWIAEMVQIYGYIRREHVMKKFRVSALQASHDMATARKIAPDLMSYDPSEKRYVAKATPK